MTPQRLLVAFMERKIGDAIFSLPALRAVRRHFGPDTEIWVMHRQHRTIADASFDIISAGAEVDGFIPFPDHHNLPAVLSLILRLRLMKFSCAVYTSSAGISEPILRRYIYLMKAVGISTLIGFHPHNPQNRRDVSECNLFPQKSEAHRRLHNLARDGMDVSAESDFSSPLLVLSEAARNEAGGWLHEKSNRLDRRYIAVCPGAASPANIWPVARFIEIGHRLMRLSRYEMIVCGGRAEQTLGDRMLTAWGRGINAAGHFPVLGTAAILKECLFMIGLDTGTTHLAAAVGVPCVNLQGGRRLPGYWDPLGAGHIIVRHPVNCIGCGRTSCVTPKHPCMRGITVETVWQAVLQMLESRAIRDKTMGTGVDA
jgi:ADP-heptose:LPS heptosyltransferase